MINIEELVNEKSGLINYFSRIDPKPHSPKMHRYLATIKNPSTLGVQEISGSGFSLIEENAKYAAVGEAIERYCARIESNSEVFESTYKNIKTKKVDINTITKHQKFQYENIDFLQPFEENKEIKWTKVINYFSNELYVAPNELVYLNPLKRDKPFRDIISTGLACASSINSAILSALNECIERDAFMLFWLLGKVNFEIKVDKINNSFFKKLFIIIKNCNLDIKIYDITQKDLNIPTILCVVKRRGRKGFYVSCASHFDYSTAVKKSIEEGLGGFGAYIESIYYYKTPVPKSIDEIRTLDDHALYYLAGNNDTVLDFLIGEPKTIAFSLVENITSDKESLMKKFQELKYDIYFKDLTTIDIKEIGLCVVRVITPQLVFLSAGPPMLDCSRLYQKTKGQNINMEPHPFP